MICYIRIFHIRPKTDGEGEILPHSLVFPNALLAFLDERLKSVFLDLLLAVKTEQLLDLKLNRETVSVPACLTGNLIAFHCAVTWNKILDNTGKNVTDMRLAVGCRRSVIENIGRTLLLAGFFKDLVFFPEFLDSFFTLDEVQVCRNFLIHCIMTPFDVIEKTPPCAKQDEGNS